MIELLVNPALQAFFGRLLAVISVSITHSIATKEGGQAGILSKTIVTCPPSLNEPAEIKIVLTFSPRMPIVKLTTTKATTNDLP